MKRKRSTLVELYRRIPGIPCRGLCASSCGPLAVSQREADRMAAHADGRPLTVDQDLRCGYLHDGRCTVYDVRPALCRLWGVVPEMPCLFGCVPDRVLPPTEARLILRTLERIGGGLVVSTAKEGE